MLIIGIVGVLMQQVFLRWNQGQDLRQALITIALSVIFADQMLAAFGGISKDIKTPTDWPESITLPGEVRFGFFRGVVVLGAALLIGVGLWWLITRTRFGKIVRAGVDDRDMVVGARHQRAARLRGRVLPRRHAGGSRRRTRRHDDLARAGRGHLVPAQLADRRDHRRDGIARRRCHRCAGARLVDAYADVYLVFGDTDLTNYSILLTFALLVVVLAVRPLGLFGRPA